MRFKVKKVILLVTIMNLFLSNFAFAKTTLKSIPEQKEIKLEDGYYKIPVKLFNQVEDKESMGNKALNQTCEIEVKDKKANLYIGSNKMEYLSITASLANIYFQKEDGNFYPAEANCYEMEVPGEKTKRPLVFKTSLINMDDIINVYVDPKVEPMGDEPIKSRLKLDFNKIEKITKDDTDLIKKFENGLKKKEFNKDDSGEVQNKNLIVSYEKETFDEEFTFYGNKLSGKNQEKYSNEFDKLEMVNAFKIEFLAPIEKITGKEKSVQEERKKILPKKEFTLKLPLLKFEKNDNLILYDFTNGEKKKIDFKIEDDHIVTKAKNSGVYAIVKSNAISEKNTVLTNNETKSENKNDFVDSAKENTQVFLNTMKKPEIKPIQNTKTEKKVVTNNILPNTPLKKQIEISEKNQKNQENESEDQKKIQITQEQIKEKESKGIIFFILFIFILLNTISIFVIRKNFKQIQDMKEEMRFMRGLKENEK